MLVKWTRNGSQKAFSTNACSAFTLPEVLCAAALIVVAVASIYLALGQGYNFTQEALLNRRAAQILTGKMETMRLYNWSQITSNGYVPSSFTNYYYPNGTSNISTGVTYTGSVSIGNVNFTNGESYSNDMRQITVTLSWYPGANWTAGSKLHQLSASTFVAHYGMQNYIYQTTK